MRVAIHVRPGASATAVGGEHDGALVVRVVEAPHGGRATEAALQAIAKALSLPRSSVALVRGGRSRRKLVEINAGSSEERIEAAVARLRNG